MRTTNKAFKALVQEHILECLEKDQFNNVQAQLQGVVVEFINWYSPYEQKMQPNEQAAFIDWLKGLPSVLNVEFSSFMICETLKYWFTHPTVNTTFIERSADKEAETYYHLIYREFRILCTKYDVKWSVSK